MPSFDIVSEIPEMALKNAIENCRRELRSRWDFRGADTEIDWDEDKCLTLSATSEMHLRQMVELLRTQMTRQQVELNSVDFTPSPAHSGKQYRLELPIKAGLTKELMKALTTCLREGLSKVQTQIQGDKVRVTAKSRDLLQSAIQLLKSQTWERPLQFTHYKD